jgi:beta-glucanase (GH16 family)
LLSGQAYLMEGSTMRLRHELAIGFPIVGVFAVLAALVPAVAPAFGTQASVTAISRAAPAAALAVRPPRGKPAFDATFGGSKLYTKAWDTCYPKLANYKGGCTNFGNHMEAEWYLPSQVRVSGGAVHLVAQRKRTVGITSTGKRKVYGCRSGMITSYPGLKFEYGFVQVVANIPHANGLWPALWLAAADGKYPPEIDMVESWGVSAETASFFHSVTGSTSRARYSPKLTRGWQTYSLSWTSSTLKYWVGNKLVLTVNRNVPHQRMYFIADLAEYLPAKPAYCTGQLMIRSVKIWKG